MERRARGLSRDGNEGASRIECQGPVTFVLGPDSRLNAQVHTGAQVWSAKKND